MRKITREMLMELLTYNPETGEFFWKQSRGTKSAGAPAGHKDRHGYIRIGISETLHAAHRLAWLIYHGDMPSEGMDIDHANLNKSDNRIANLRLATRSHNRANTPVRTDNRSGFKGVRFVHNKWQARICVNGANLYLGSFSSIEEAKSAYAKQAKAVFGEFARSHEN